MGSCVDNCYFQTPVQITLLPAGEAICSCPSTQLWVPRINSSAVYLVSFVGNERARVREYLSAVLLEGAGSCSSTTSQLQFLTLGPGFLCLDDVPDEAAMVTCPILAQDQTNKFSSSKIRAPPLAEELAIGFWVRGRYFSSRA